MTLPDRMVAVTLGPRSPAVDQVTLKAPIERPTPLRQFVLKIASRCNLACTYCYVYRMADDSWRSQPHRMSRQTINRTAHRIAQHAASHGLSRVSVVFHGGEPLLAGGELLGYAAETMRSTIANVTVDLRIQTNGTLLDEDTLDVLLGHDIRVGVSLDGSSAQNDVHRRDAAGGSTHQQTAAAIARLSHPRYRHLFLGILCVVDITNDPLAVYEALVSHSPPHIDFLLPHRNWSNPPPRLRGYDDEYAEWLIKVFDRWYESRPKGPAIRLFDDLMTLLLGGRGTTEQLGLSPVAFVVVDTDGSLQQTDTLKSVRHGASATALHVERDTLDAALEHAEIRQRQSGLDGLCDVCRDCSVVRVCGAGNYAHRYRAGAGFDNPSVYCVDLKRFIEHVAIRMRRDLRMVQ
jgi:uncharacterized protein